MTYRVQQKVLFKHCDPAGIVFYPRYFEIVNDAMETFFADALATPWETFHRDRACPTVDIRCAFEAVSRHGDMLDLAIDVQRLGRTSATVLVAATCGGEVRFRATLTLVCIARDTMRPDPWPEETRARLEGHLADEADAG